MMFGQEPIMEVESPSMSTPGKSMIRIPSPKIDISNDRK